MLVATRVMNLLSGILILASGLCIGVRFAGILSDSLRMYVVLAALLYFGWQLSRFVRLECRPAKGVGAARSPRKLGLDFGRQ